MSVVKLYETIRERVLNNIHPLNFDLVKTAATATLRELLCEFLYARGRTRVWELRAVNCEYLTAS